MGEEGLHPIGICVIKSDRRQSGRSSGVEHNLAKVRVGRSNRLARSNKIKGLHSPKPQRKVP